MVHERTLLRQVAGLLLIGLVVLEILRSVTDVPVATDNGLRISRGQVGEDLRELVEEEVLLVLLRESVSPDGRYREATRTGPPSASTVAAMKRPDSEKDPKPTETSLSGVRERMPTPARPFAADSAWTKCQPASRAGASAFWVSFGFARTSCMRTTSAVVSSSQTFIPGLFSLRCLQAARMPLTLTLAIVKVMRASLLARKRNKTTAVVPHRVLGVSSVR